MELTLLCVEDFAPVPDEVGGSRAEGRLGSEGERTAVKVGEFEVRAPGKDGFGDVGMGDADAEIVIDGPESGVEEIVGGRGQGQAVLGAVWASLGVGVDVGSLKRHVGRLGRNEAVTRQGACKMVARDDRDLETGVPAPAKLGLVGGLVLADLGYLVRRRHWDTKGGA